MSSQKISRREFLKRAAVTASAGALVPSFAACTEEGIGDALPRYEYDGPVGPETLFEHGVASGDPTSDGVILWTRLSPEEGAGQLEVFWEIAVDPEFENRVDAGWAVTDETLDYTVKLDAFGLASFSDYWYRFSALGRTSRVGRTKTAPEGGVEHLRFAVMSCSNYAHGFFHGYRHAVERDDFDAILHLGDYIYEYENGGYGNARELDPPHEIVSLEDYRRRYAYYRRDMDLQDLHARYPVIAIWDDHESANDSWEDGAENHQPDEEGPWSDRKAAAEQAYAEWLPIREDEQGRIFRSLSYGDLVDLLLLDTRLWGRDEQTRDRATIRSEERTLLGDDQERWLAEQIAGSTATWRLVGQQVMMGNLKSQGLPNSEGGGGIINNDQWDGYQASRQRFYDAIKSNGQDNVVVLTGDIHTSWAIDLAEDPNNPDAYDPETGEGAVAVEFVTPGITSPGLTGGLDIIVQAALQENPHIKFSEVTQRGYISLDVTAERVQATWYHYEDPAEESPEISVGAVWAVFSGESHVVEQSTGDAA